MEIQGQLVHKAITPDAILDAVERAMMTLDNPGFCLVCGEEAFSCEPDMEHGHCESCEAHQVYGAEQLLLLGLAG